jgi:hypothetical protein
MILYIDRRILIVYTKTVLLGQTRWYLFNWTCKTAHIESSTRNPQHPFAGFVVESQFSRGILQHPMPENIRTPEGVVGGSMPWCRITLAANRGKVAANNRRSKARCQTGRTAFRRQTIWTRRTQKRTVPRTNILFRVFKK